MLPESDRSGNAVLYSDNWEPIDVSSSNFKPGKSFSLLVGQAGKLRVRGAGMDRIKAGDIKAIPVQQGYNPIICTEILYHDTENTAADIWALYAR